MKKIWDGKFTKPINKQYHISLCTTTMNRLYDLQKTLPVNIELNKDYKKLEFVILDYNSVDDVEKWMKNNMMKHIRSGLVVYYKTTEPKYYSMSHSRNIAFKVASGDIVNNVDADNFTEFDDTNDMCFVKYLNRLANEQPRKAIFSKGKRLMHGRLGFFKDEFIDLGGYDEGLVGYGHDDKDLMHRAWALGFTLMWFGGQYVYRIKTSRHDKVRNMSHKNWKETEKMNKEISANNMSKGIYKANQDMHWGKACLIKNFTEQIEV